MSAQTAADLRAAAEVLRRDGWTQGAMHRKCGHCAVGAIDAVVDSLWHQNIGWDREQNERFSAATGALHGVIGRNPTAWNDEHGRTADEVIAALLAAADVAEDES